MNQPVRLALVGCGQIGRLHAERIVADGRAQIVAVCDPLLSSTERLRDDFACQARVCTLLSQVLEAEALDAVVICSPTHLHYEQVRELRRHNLPILCEKPLADSRDRIVELIELTQTGPLFTLAYQRRCHATFRTLRREVQSGRWGRIRSVTTHSSERWQQTIGGTWRDDPKFNPGGFIGDAGSHKIDMLFFVTGLKPAEVFACSDRRGSRVEITTTITGRLSGDVPLSMNFIGDAHHWREDFQIHCEEADLSIREGQVWIARNNHVEQVEPLERETNPNTAFLDSLLDGVENFAPAACALPVWDFTQAVLQSARVRQVVKIEDRE